VDSVDVDVVATVVVVAEAEINFFSFCSSTIPHHCPYTIVRKKQITQPTNLTHKKKKKGLESTCRLVAQLNLLNVL